MIHFSNHKFSRWYKFCTCFKSFQRYQDIFLRKSEVLNGQDLHESVFWFRTVRGDPFHRLNIKNFIKWRKTSGYASNPTNKMISILIFDRNYEQRLILEWKPGRIFKSLIFEILMRFHSTDSPTNGSVQWLCHRIDPKFLCAT